MVNKYLLNWPEFPISDLEVAKSKNKKPTIKELYFMSSEQEKKKTTVNHFFEFLISVLFSEVSRVLRLKKVDNTTKWGKT